MNIKTSSEPVPDACGLTQIPNYAIWGAICKFTHDSPANTENKALSMKRARRMGIDEVAVKTFKLTIKGESI